MRYLYITLVSCISISSVFAQQQAQYSQYMNNNFTINPAVGGTESFIDLKAAVRTQWVGFDGAPTDIYVTGHGSIGKQTPEFDDIKPLAYHGVGGMVYSDATGPTNKLGIYGSYSYHLPITTKLTAAFGAFVGIQQFKVDVNQLEFHDDQFGSTDQSIAGLSTKLLPDVNVGFWLYHSDWYVGGAMYQVLGNQIDLEGTSVTTSSAKLNNHWYGTAGYKIEVSDKIIVVPSFVVRGVSPAPVQFDLNAKVRYGDILWGGVSYRNKDAIVALIGATFLEKIDVGYSYDFTTSNIKLYSSGSHEILVGYRIPQSDDTKPTSQFW